MRSEAENEERRKFVSLWAEYVRTHTDREWSEQQRLLIDSQIQSARAYPLTKEQYLEMKSKQSPAK